MICGRMPRGGELFFCWPPMDQRRSVCWRNRITTHSHCLWRAENVSCSCVGVLERFFAGIRGGVLVTAANTMAAGARIVAARPELADRIAAEILTVSHAEYASPECRNVAMGHAIAALEEFVGRLCYPRAVFRFVRRQLRNPRLATRTRAERFLLRHAPHLL